MLPGFGGRLLSGHVLEQYLLASRDSEMPLPARAAMRRWREQQRQLGPASSLRAMVDAGARPLSRLLGFELVEEGRSRRDISTATLRAGNVRITVMVGRWGDRLEPLWRPAVTEALERDTRWALVFNGTHARLFDSSRVFSRRFVEFDLDAAADDDRTAAALWTTLNVRAFESAHSGAALLPSLIGASERHASDVCRSLRAGVLEASTHLLRALVARSGRTPLNDVFEQALTIVYRILFLFFAEARSLVPLWHPLYRGSYSLERLRDRALERSTVGLWDTLGAVARLAHAGCHAGDLRVTPFNGRLFAPSRTPLADRRGLDDEAARLSLVALSTRAAADGEGREPIAYRDLGVEQLGAVYETLLDYAPRVVKQPPVAKGPNGEKTVRPKPDTTVVALERGSGIRKATGTFYTPETLTSYLIRRALGPLVRDRTAEEILTLRVLDPSMGSGAFLVSACRFLADAYEAALVRDGGCLGSDLGPAERAAIRRTVAERCLYGVDLNPMAVQLARLSLWLATLSADRPLGFLDHHLLVGNSLLGTTLACLRQPPPARRRRTENPPLFDALPANDALRDALPVRFGLGLDPSDTPAQVHAKERALAALASHETALSRWKRVADLWCAQWFDSELRLGAPLYRTLARAIVSGERVLPGATGERLLTRVAEISQAHGFFHWELEYPEVFFDGDARRRPLAGFDAVVGNPPWDMVRADDAVVNDRGRQRTESAALVRFSRDAGVYTAQSNGHANRYQMFLERAIALTRPGGRIGMVLPWGVAADQGSARLRRLLFSTCDVDALVGFENRERIFPIHRSVRFLLLSATAGVPTESIGCRLGETSQAILDTAGDADARTWFTLRLTPALLRRLSGPDLAVPEFKTAMDVTIAERAGALFAPLGDAAGWNAHFGRELNATEDRDAFLPPGRGLAVLEGKHVDAFKVRVEDARASIGVPEADRRLGQRPTCPRLAYRDVASATNRTTLIAALVPPGAVTTHTLFCVKTRLPPMAQHFLCGLFNSFLLNFLVRLRVTTHVTTAIVERLPVPRQDQAGGAYREIAGLARLLARRESPAHLARLNALVAQLYELSADEFGHVLDTFPLVPAEDRALALHALRRT